DVESGEIYSPDTLGLPRRSSSDGQARRFLRSDFNPPCQTKSAKTLDFRCLSFPILRSVGFPEALAMNFGKLPVSLQTRRSAKRHGISPKCCRPMIAVNNRVSAE